MGLEDIKQEIYTEYRRRVGSKFKDSEFIQHAIDAFANTIYNKGVNKGVIISGRTGVGKTVLLKSAVAIWDRHNKVKMEYLPSSKIPTITTKSEGYASTIDYRMPYLAIDDIGAEPEVIKLYGVGITPLVDIVQYRTDMKDRRKILFATTNLTPNMIGERYGDRVKSRLRGENKIILVKGDDNRTTK